MHTRKEKSQVSHLSFHWDNQGKKEQKKPKANRRKKLIKTIRLSTPGPAPRLGNQASVCLPGSCSSGSETHRDQAGDKHRQQDAASVFVPLSIYGTLFWMKEHQGGGSAAGPDVQNELAGCQISSWDPIVPVERGDASHLQPKFVPTVNSGTRFGGNSKLSLMG